MLASQGVCKSCFTPKSSYQVFDGKAGRLQHQPRWLEAKIDLLISKHLQHLLTPLRWGGGVGWVVRAVKRASKSYVWSLCRTSEGRLDVRSTLGSEPNMACAWYLNDGLNFSCFEESEDNWQMLCVVFWHPNNMSLMSPLAYSTEPWLWECFGLSWTMMRRGQNSFSSVITWAVNFNPLSLWRMAGAPNSSAGYYN